MALNFFTGFLALGTGSTSFVELSAVGYSRLPITFGPMVSGNTQSNTGLNFPGPGTWPTATQYGLFDASGNLLMWFNASVVSKSGQIVVSLTSIALALPDMVSPPQNASLIFAPGAFVAVASMVTGALSGNPGSIINATVKAGSPLQVASGQTGAM